MVKEKQIGKITHFFDKISVAVIELMAGLKVGETIHVVGGNRDFTQTVDSMQVEHESISKAKKGDQVGLEVSQPVREGDKVYRTKE